MPRVRFTDTKGLYQDAGSGLILQGEMTYRTEVVDVTSTPVSLLASQSGATVLLNNGTTATVVNLPAGSTCEVGTFFNFVVCSVNDDAAGYKIKRGTNDEIIKGALPIVSATVDKTAMAYSTASNDQILLSAEDDATQAGTLGSHVELMWDGTSWLVIDGRLLAVNAGPTQASSKVFANVA